MKPTTNDTTDTTTASLAPPNGWRSSLPRTGTPGQPDQPVSWCRSYSYAEAVQGILRDAAIAYSATELDEMRLLEWALDHDRPTPRNIRESGESDFARLCAHVSQDRYEWDGYTGSRPDTDIVEPFVVRGGRLTTDTSTWWGKRLLARCPVWNVIRTAAWTATQGVCVDWDQLNLWCRSHDSTATELAEILTHWREAHDRGELFIPGDEVVLPGPFCIRGGWLSADPGKGGAELLPDNHFSPPPSGGRGYSWSGPYRPEHFPTGVVWPLHEYRPVGEPRLVQLAHCARWTQDSERLLSDGHVETNEGWFRRYVAKDGVSPLPDRDYCLYCGADNGANSEDRQGYDCWNCGGN